MADKEVTTFVVDVGPSMSHVSLGNSLNDLQVGLRYVKDILISKVMKGRKTDYVQGFANGTDESCDMRDHVSQLHNIKPPTYEDVGKYELETNPKKVEDDLIMASLLGSLEMFNFTNKKKFKKNLIVVTNSLHLAPSFGEKDVLEQMVSFLNENAIKFIVVGVDFDGPDAETSTVNAWRDLKSRINDSYILSGVKAMECVNYPGIKPTRPTKLFEAQLRIGANLLDPQLYRDEEAMGQSKATRKANKTSASWVNFQEDQSCLSIPIEGYGAVRVAKPPSFTQFGVTENGDIKPMKAETNYEIRNYTNDVDNIDEIENQDDDELLTKSFEIEPVERDQLIDGFKYGKNVVVLNEVLNKKRKYKTVSGLDIGLVIKSNELPRVYMSEEATLILGSKDSTNDQMAIAAIVDVLTEMKSYAIARFVRTPESEVEMVALIPVYVKKNGGISSKRSANDSDLIETRALIMNRLPFFEDEKISSFPTLSTLKTTSGRIITSDHPLLPSFEVDEAMDSLVRNMDLGTTSTDFEEEKVIFNPSLSSSLLPLPESKGNHDNLVKLSTGLHRLQQTIKDILIKASFSSSSVQDFVAKHQEDMIPPLSKELERDTQPDTKLLNKVADDLAKLKKLLNIQAVDKTKPRRRKAISDEIDEYRSDDDEFEELSLEQLLQKGFD